MRCRTFALLAASVAFFSGCSDTTAPSSTSPAQSANATAPSAPSPTAPSISAWDKPSVEVPHTALCNIDSINGTPPTVTVQAVKDKPLSIAGWVSTANLKNPGKFDLVLEGEKNVKISSVTNTQRPDVAAGYKSPDLAGAGFAIDLPSLNLEPGKYHLSLQHQGTDSLTLCDAKIDLVVQ